VPIYEYQCTKCGEVFEVFQKINDEPVKRCKLCQGGVEKIISHSSFHLKGSGWYLTDYSRKSQPAEGSSEASKETSKPTDTKASPVPGSGSPTESAKVSESKT